MTGIGWPEAIFPPPLVGGRKKREEKTNREKTSPRIESLIAEISLFILFHFGVTA